MCTWRDDLNEEGKMSTKKRKSLEQTAHTTNPYLFDMLEAQIQHLFTTLEYEAQKVFHEKHGGHTNVRKRHNEQQHDDLYYAPEALTAQMANTPALHAIIPPTISEKKMGITPIQQQRRIRGKEGQLESHEEMEKKYSNTRKMAHNTCDEQQNSLIEKIFSNEHEMKVVENSGIEEIQRLRQHSSSSTSPRVNSRTLTPRSILRHLPHEFSVEVCDDGDAYTIEAVLPACHGKSALVEIRDNMLILSVTKQPACDGLHSFYNCVDEGIDSHHSCQVLPLSDHSTLSSTASIVSNPIDSFASKNYTDVVSQSIMIPQNVDPNSCHAVCTAGVIRISLPRCLGFLVVFDSEIFPSNAPCTLMVLGMSCIANTSTNTNTSINILPLRCVHILLACTGSVATIKTNNVAHVLETLDERLEHWDSQARYAVHVKIVATERAMKFVKLYKQTRTDDNTEKNPSTTSGTQPTPHILTDQDEWESYTKIGDEILHIQLRKWADIMIIAPLSANTMAKMVNGMCDNLVTSVVRAWDRKRPMLVAPAMNTHMYTNPITAKHLETLRELQIHIVEPTSKKLACGDVGIGAMADPATIADRVFEALKQRLIDRMQEEEDDYICTHPE